MALLCAGNEDGGRSGEKCGVNHQIKIIKVDDRFNNNFLRLKIVVIFSDLINEMLDFALVLVRIFEFGQHLALEEEGIMNDLLIVDTTIVGVGDFMLQQMINFGIEYTKR